MCIHIYIYIHIYAYTYMGVSCVVPTVYVPASPAPREARGANSY